MDALCELARSTLEECDRLELAAAMQLASRPKTHKERLLVERRVRKYIDEIADKSRYLQKLFRDEDGQLAKEIQSFKVTPSSSSSDTPSTPAIDLTGFYDRLVQIKEYHRKFPMDPVREFDPMSVARDPDLEMQELDASFTGEEGYGRYLDFTEIFRMYLNLKTIEKISYENYLSRVDHFKSISVEIKSTPEYLEYLNTLRQYLESFFDRAKPLVDLASIRQKEMTRFEDDWINGQVRGWERSASDMDPNADNLVPDTDLYCVACDKLFAKQTVFDAHKTGKKHVKAIKMLAEKGVDATNIQAAARVRYDQKQAEWEKKKPVAWLETLITKYMQDLAGEREDTRAHVERKQALTDKERMQEPDEDDMILDDDEDQDDGDHDNRIYNPLKLPLDWDGKPIPFWLYKLHGLSVKLPCEICGGHVYRGRRDFDRHFQDWRHTQGMRNLGLSNTKHFNGITSIEDAYALNERLKQLAKEDTIAPDAVEEYEDSKGNVYNKKTYEDLKRQGLL